RHPLRHALEPLRRAVQGRPLAGAREARAAEAERPVRDRARRARVHRQCPARSARGRARPRRLRGGRSAAHPGSRLSGPALHSDEVLLEERQVAARNRALRRRQARLLGALRLPQRRRLLARGAVRLLARSRDSGERRARPISPVPTSPPQVDETAPSPAPFRFSEVERLRDPWCREKTEGRQMPALRRSCGSPEARYIIPPMSGMPPPMPAPAFSGASATIASV